MIITAVFCILKVSRYVLGWNFPLTYIFLFGIWEFNSKNSFLCTTSSCTTFYSQQVNGNDGNISWENAHIVVMRILEYLHENLFPIGWKPPVATDSNNKGKQSRTHPCALHQPPSVLLVVKQFVSQSSLQCTQWIAADYWGVACY